MLNSPFQMLKFPLLISLETLHLSAHLVLQVVGAVFCISREAEALVVIVDAVATIPLMVPLVLDRLLHLYLPPTPTIPHKLSATPVMAMVTMLINVPLLDPILLNLSVT